MSDHMHESYEVYGLDDARQDAREALQLVGGLREDLSAAEARIRELEDRVGQLERSTADLAESGHRESGEPAYLTEQCRTGVHLCSGCDCGCHLEPDDEDGPR